MAAHMCVPMGREQRRIQTNDHTEKPQQADWVAKQV